MMIEMRKWITVIESSFLVANRSGGERERVLEDEEDE